MSTTQLVKASVYGHAMAAASRRSPGPEARQRDPDRTRAALLDAAMEEFASKGRAGARVSAIAERAGVNKQLISYYFGGKQGLYDALLQRWYEEEEDFADPAVTLGEVARRYLEAGVSTPELHKMFVRESIDEDVSTIPYEPDSHELVDMRRRQDEGEIGPDLDPAYVLLALQGMVVAGIVFPRDVKRFLGLDPGSPEFLEHAGDQILKIVRRLAADPD